MVSSTASGLTHPDTDNLSFHGKGLTDNVRCKEYYETYPSEIGTLTSCIAAVSTHEDLRRQRHLVFFPNTRDATVMHLMPLHHLQARNDKGEDVRGGGKRSGRNQDRKIRKKKMEEEQEEGINDKAAWVDFASCTHGSNIE